jgi:hypothetical protein
MTDIRSATTVSPSAAQPSPPSTGGVSLWSHGGFGFKDLLDIINPLQHLPIVGSIYRYLSGDEPSGGARIVGDALYGGPIGFGVGVVTTMLTDSSGRDLGEKALAAVFGPPGSDPSPTMLATASPAAQTALVQPARSSAIASEASALSPAIQSQMAATLYRSPTAAAPNAPEQNFMAQNPQFQRQLAGNRPEATQFLPTRPIPLELTGSLMPVNRLNPAAAPHVPALAQMPNANSPVAKEEPGPNPVAQKMLNALDKYERMKRQQKQDDRGNSPMLDMAL